MPSCKAKTVKYNDSLERLGIKLRALENASYEVCYIYNFERNLRKRFGKLFFVSCCDERVGFALDVGVSCGGPVEEAGLRGAGASGEGKEAELRICVTANPSRSKSSIRLCLPTKWADPTK